MGFCRQPPGVSSMGLGFVGPNGFQFAIAFVMGDPRARREGRGIGAGDAQLLSVPYRVPRWHGNAVGQGGLAGVRHHHHHAPP